MGCQNLDNIRFTRKWLGEKYGYDFADAMLANMQVETANTFDPATIQKGSKDENGVTFTNESYIKAVESGEHSFVDHCGWGMCQWTSDGRKGNFLKFFGERGLHIYDLKGQLMFFDWEVQTTGYANVRKAIKEHWGLDECTRVICTDYERPRSMQQGEAIKEQAIQKRIAYARAIRAFFEAEEKEEQKAEVTPLAKNGMIICLDAGHYYKYNRSPVVLAYYESDFTWKFTMCEKAEYERLGFTVILTRSDKDKDLSLDKRGKMSKGCVLFKSNHSNACGTESVDHPSIIIPVEYKGVDFEGCKVLGNRIGENIHKVMGTKQVAKVYFKDAGYDRNGNGKRNDDEYYGVMHGAQSVKCPRYMIVEHGFHTNRANATWLLNDENIKRLAISEAQVVAQFLLGLEPSDTHIDDVQPIGTITYVTKAGDTLSKIAKDYGVTVADIVALNGIANPNLIGKNVKLLIPATTSKIRYYTVKHRDTLSAIARDYTLKGHKVTYIDIAKANNIPFPYRDIHPGDTLIIP